MKPSTIGWAILGGIAAIGGALYVYARQQALLLQNYTYKITDLKITTFDLQKIKGQLSVFFGSKADVEVLVEKFYLDFYLNGENVGYLEDTTEFVIPAQGSTIIPLNFTLNPQIVLNNAADIVSFALTKKDASISIRGYAKMKSGFVKVTLPIAYDSTVKQILAD